MDTLKNPHLQHDENKIPKRSKSKMTFEPCHDGKNRAAPHYRKDHLYAPGEAFSSDVAGPINFKGERMDQPYFVTCLDAASRYAYCVPLKDRTQVVPFIQQCVLLFMDVFNKPPKIFVSDNAKDYVSKEMHEVLDAFNIQHHPRTPYHEQENALAERINQTFMNGIGSALYTANMEKHYWHFALIDVVDKYSQLHHKAIKTSQYMKF